jgi:hypothetical protein
MNYATNRSRSRTLGWLTLAFGVSAAALLALRLTGAFQYYCDGSRTCREVLLGAASWHLAMLGLAVFAVLIATRLWQAASSTYVKITVLAVAIAFLIVDIANSVSAYDQMWASFGTGAALDAPQSTPVLPLAVLAVSSVIWPILLAIWIIGATLGLRALGVPRALALVGGVSGLVLLASTAIAPSEPWYLNIAYGLAVVWATGVGLRLLAAEPRVVAAAK